MTFNFPKTYADLRKAPYINDIENAGSDGIFLYIEEKYLYDENNEIQTNGGETIAWGHTLSEALANLRDDYWKYIEPSFKPRKRNYKIAKSPKTKTNFPQLQKLLNKIL
tara:strand:+ start:66 stop:392 length:327 start_codon:yes stop_codon:yes gene_type:complete